MDHSHLAANYSFDHYNEFKYDSGRNQLNTESGYDSLLATSVNSTSFFQNNDSNDSHLFSLPSTPVKSAPKFIYNGNNCSTTPDFKQQYVADINGLYFKTIRAGSYTDSPQSDQFSSSQSQSPKSSFCPNMDTNLYTRDNFTSKLLRSPAFKIEQSPQNTQRTYQPERPNIKSFSSRFTEALPSFEAKKPMNTTPTQAEFMDLLISNHCIPHNPEFLIGRRMGVDNVNIPGELNSRGMNNVLDKIFSYMSIGDIVRVGCVSKEWRGIVKNNPINTKRLRHIKSKRHTYEFSKENHGSIARINTIEMKRKNQTSVFENKQHSEKSVNTEAAGGVFCSVDINALNNRDLAIRKRNLERQFKEFSITDEPNFNMTPHKRSPIKRRSPMKLLTCITTPMSICSKKSKRNLKRL